MLRSVLHFAWVLNIVVKLYSLRRSLSIGDRNSLPLALIGHFFDEAFYGLEVRLRCSKKQNVN